MREGTPRFENDDFSPYSGSDYREKGHPGVSGKSRFGKGPRGYRRTDDRIYEEVCVALMNDPTVDASEIGVKVHDGIVTLEGHAHGRTEKRIAEMISVEIPGVLDVRNDIRIA